MKSFIPKTIALVTFSLTLLSFSFNFGGEGFEIFLNGKILVQRYGSDMHSPGTIRLNAGSSKDQLAIKYHHCGKVGKGRAIAIRNAQNKFIKEWRFSDAATPASFMYCNVKDILDLKKANGNMLKLYYSSTELPKGRLLIILE